jgi:hypothetical protein
MKTVYFVVFALVLLSMPGYAQIPTDGLVAWYRLNGNASDESSNGNNGTIIGGVTPTTSRYGAPNAALSFDGTTGYVWIPNSVSLQSPTTGLTLSAWINIEQLTSFASLAAMVNKSMTGNYGQYLLNYSTSGTIHINSTANGTTAGAVVIPQALNLHQWYHVATTWGDGARRVYIDGVEVANSLSTGTISSDTNSVLLGLNTPGLANLYLNGMLDDIRIYDHPLSSGEISSLYNEPAGNADGLILDMPFTGDAQDHSGFENHGTLNGGPVLAADRFESPGTAYSFDGSDDYILVNNSESFPDSAITLCYWINRLGQSYTGLQNYLSKEESFQSYLTNTTKHFQSGVWKGSPGVWSYNPSGNYVVPDNSEGWIFYTYSYDNTSKTAKSYVDGVLMASETETDPASILRLSGNPLYVGRNGSSNVYHIAGLMDDLRIYSRVLTQQEILLLYGKYRQQISSVVDIPDDQGGRVRVSWDRIYLDSTGTGGQVTSYGVWRKILPGMVAKSAPPAGLLAANDTLGSMYDYVGMVHAVQSDTYHLVVNTLYDSSESGAHDETFLISAHTADPNIYFLSIAAEGHSVDNLSPSAVQGVAAVVHPGPSVGISWDKNLADPDVREYQVHRSKNGGFIPDGTTMIAQSEEAVYSDMSPELAAMNYYKIVAVDYHGNQSAPSSVAPVVVGGTEIYSVMDKWNLVSVPLKVADYSKSVLFPTATSSAFAYSGSYIAASYLQNGQGYWLKFAGDQLVPITGYQLLVDSIPVSEGWNLIGSISLPVDVASITSDPPGMTTSNFFRYSHAYDRATIIEPGNGYWVKVSESGLLILTSGPMSSPANRIQIHDTGEMPPPPPGIDGSVVPSQAMLEQNYPNPFNPVTEIRYTISDVSQVELTVYSVLGEKIATLVSEVQAAGNKSVQFDASQYPSGIYTYRLTAGSSMSIKRMILLK